MLSTESRKRKSGLLNKVSDVIFLEEDEYEFECEGCGCRSTSCFVKKHELYDNCIGNRDREFTLNIDDGLKIFYRCPDSKVCVSMELKNMR